MTLTDKQKDIIKTINLGHERGHLLDLDELLEVLPYRTTKQSMQFPARADQERFGRKARLPAARGFWLPASNSGADDIRSSQSQVTGDVSWSGSQINSLRLYI